MRQRRSCVYILLLAWLAAPGLAAQEGSASAEVLLGADDAAQAARPDFGDAPRGDAREAMVREQIAGRGVDDDRVLDTLRRLPRHEFVPGQLQARAYTDSPLPIGHGQTISQPYIVGYMTEMLELEPDDRVLEVGTGSGYQAAVLADLVSEVVSIEIIRALAASAAHRLEALDFANVTVLHGDGYHGWAQDAPYDAVVVTAAATHVPPPLVEQLKPGARMVIPVGRSGWTQNLLLVEKDAEGETATRNLMAVRFVPLTRGE